MHDLVVCVGESCHLSGAEMVVKSFKERIEEQGLKTEVALKGSFCIGECCEKGEDEVSVRWQDRIILVKADQASEAFDRQIRPAVRARQEG